MARHYKASYVLEDRGGATAPGAELSLRPTGGAAGGMNFNLATFSKQELRELLIEVKQDLKAAEAEYENQIALAHSATSNEDRQHHITLATNSGLTIRACQYQYDAIHFELEARSGGAGGASGGSRF